MVTSVLTIIPPIKEYFSFSPKLKILFRNPVQKSLHIVIQCAFNCCSLSISSISQSWLSFWVCVYFWISLFHPEWQCGWIEDPPADMLQCYISEAQCQLDIFLLSLCNPEIFLSSYLEFSSFTRICPLCAFSHKFTLGNGDTFQYVDSDRSY